MSSKDAKRSVDGKAMELHEVEAGAFKATAPLTLPALVEKKAHQTDACDCRQNELPQRKGHGDAAEADFSADNER